MKSNQAPGPHSGRRPGQPTIQTAQPSSGRQSGRALLLAVVALLAMLVGLVAARSMFETETEFQSASIYPQPRALAPFELIDADGAAFTDQNLQGRHSLIFFGFTNCPDICPDTLGVLADAMQKLETMRVANKPQVVFVSVDPERDGGQAMGEYVTWFHPDFRAVTGDDQALAQLTSQLGAMYVRRAPDDTGFYSVDHSGMVVIVDPQGRMIGRFTQPLDSDAVAADLFDLGRGA
ncbi:MAG: SCO family protein [Wenzhouxiangellaceae bacterium]|nr:SCO family protein [Wenzhouxiangellaceae bacterium]